MPRSKETTARYVLFSDFLIRWVFTVEASAFASVVRAPQDKEVVLLTPAALSTFAMGLATAVLQLSDLDLNGGIDSNTKMSKLRATLLAQCRANGLLDSMSSDEDESGAGSDDCPSDDNFDAEEREAEFEQGETDEPQRRAPQRRSTPTRSSGCAYSARTSARKQAHDYAAAVITQPWLLDDDSSSRVPHSWTLLARSARFESAVTAARLGEELQRRPRSSGVRRSEVARASPRFLVHGEGSRLCESRGSSKGNMHNGSMSARAELHSGPTVTLGRPKTPIGLREPLWCSSTAQGPQRLFKREHLQLPAGWQAKLVEHG